MEPHRVHVEGSVDALDIRRSQSHFLRQGLAADAQLYKGVLDSVYGRPSQRVRPHGAKVCGRSETALVGICTNKQQTKSEHEAATCGKDVDCHVSTYRVFILVHQLLLSPLAAREDVAEPPLQQQQVELLPAAGYHLHVLGWLYKRPVVC